MGATGELRTVCAQRLPVSHRQGSTSANFWMGDLVLILLAPAVTTNFSFQRGLDIVGEYGGGSCPKSVIDDKRFRGNKLWLDGLRGSSPKADDLAASGNPKVSGCLRFGP